ncbi:MAG: FlgD immunoglobulin-like domain containing protein [Ignavibacteria bacterium]
MKTETDFIFTLSGFTNPTSCKVKIFTVTGRVIKEIDAPANIGYNSIHWDGKDNDGDYIANGVYLYKFILQEDSQTETSTQKLVVLR